MIPPRIDNALNPYVNAVGASWAQLSREERAAVIRDMQKWITSLSGLHEMLVVAFIVEASDAPVTDGSNVIPFPKRAAR